ncbi:hypothetical protein ABW20_dc0106094 [Dactylellina cionopaga]|nr:hypothetical protein ABW20_dc0106094 [Dactylellina cionopaga]
MAEIELHWKETNPGSPGLTQGILAAGVVLSDKTVSVKAIKDAWVTLRYAHPILGCIINDTGFNYQVPTEYELKKWTEETVRVDSSGKCGWDLAVATIAPKTAELYFLPDRHELFIQVRHELIDGVGLMILLNNFLKVLREEKLNIEFGDEPVRLSRCLTEIMHAEKPSPNVIKQAQQIAEKFINRPSTSLKMKRPDYKMSLES